MASCLIENSVDWLISSVVSEAASPDVSGAIVENRPFSDRPCRTKVQRSMHRFPPILAAGKEYELATPGSSGFGARYVCKRCRCTLASVRPRLAPVVRIIALFNRWVTQIPVGGFPSNTRRADPSGALRHRAARTTCREPCSGSTYHLEANDRWAIGGTSSRQ